MTLQLPSNNAYIERNNSYQHGRLRITTGTRSSVLHVLVLRTNVAATRTFGTLRLFTCICVQGVSASVPGVKLQHDA